jgi:hypothetical protein
MVGAVALSVLLFAAPDANASKELLRVAWASQYEWREDKIRNATFDFTWTVEAQSRRGEKWKRSYSGSFVVADGEIKRVHLPGADEGRRKQVREELEWIVARFARKPFDEQFKEVKFTAPEKTADGNQRVTAGDARWLIANDRIVGEERNVGSKKKPKYIRVDFELADVGGGYAVLEESLSHTPGGVKTVEDRKLEVGEEGAIPVPTVYTRNRRDVQGKRAITVTLTNPRLNNKEPVAVDLAARELVKAAWDGRYTWPVGIRFEGEWERDTDKATSKGGWSQSARGEFQLLKGVLELTFDEKIRIRASWRTSILESATGHLRDGFERLRAIPFDEAFADIGFEFDAQGGDGVIRLLGHPKWLAVRVDDGALAAHMSDEFGDVSWWEYKLKKARDGRPMIERMTRRVGKKKRTVRYIFTKKGGAHVPKAIEVLVPARPGAGVTDPTDVGVLKYALRKLLVKTPD